MRIRYKILSYSIIAMLLFSGGYLIAVYSNGGTPTIDPVTGMSNFPWYNATAGINAPEFYLNSEDKTDLFEYPELGASYIIFKEASITYSKKGATGEIAFSGANPVTVIQNTLNALTGSRTWKEKVVIKGDYETSSEIVIPSYTILEINGKIKFASGINNDTYMFRSISGGSSNIEIYGGILDGNKAGQSSGHMTAIYFDSGCTFSKIIGILVKQFSWHGLNVQGDDLVISQNTLEYNDGSGIFSYMSDRQKIVENTVRNSGEQGLHLQDLDYGIISSNILKSNNKTQLYVYSFSWRNIIEGNSISYSGGALQWGLMLDNECDFNIITGNSIRYASASGLCLTMSDHNTIVGNIIEDSNSNGLVLDGSRYNIITGNELHSNSRGQHDTWDEIRIGQYDPIATNPSTYNIITGNMIHCEGANRARYGIYELNSSQDFQMISNNRIYGQVNVGIYSQGANTVVNNNEGFVTESSGVVTLDNGQTQKTVYHGCDYTPLAGDISVHPIESLGSASFFWVDSLTSSLFIIRVNVNPGQDVDFAWSVDNH